jgi:predicted nucleic acid-binding protein
MTGYLLDTNVVSELRKTKPHGGVIAWDRTVQRDHVYVSAVSLGEIQAGIERTRRQDKRKAAELEVWLNAISAGAQILAMDRECFREWARIMEGKSDDLTFDAMIAATARVHSLTVVTRNERDFRHFKVPVLNPFTAT